MSCTGLLSILDKKFQLGKIFATLEQYSGAHTCICVSVNGISVIHLAKQSLGIITHFQHVGQVKYIFFVEIKDPITRPVMLMHFLD